MITAMTAGKTIRSVFLARTWCSNVPVHSMYIPAGSLTFSATTRRASSTKPTSSRSRTRSWMYDAEQSVLALDHRRPLDHPDVGQLGQGDLHRRSLAGAAGAGIDAPIAHPAVARPSAAIPRAETRMFLSASTSSR